ncbi:MAG: ABC transporter permease subunit [Paracoccaceae bacterium]
MTDTSYVRTAMLPPQKPPASETGVVHWIRVNLFSSVGNIILTILSLLVIYGIVASIGPWLSRSVWNAGSLDECRAIIEATWGPGKTGACFAVINERWPQLLFGFYPKDQYWRPILTTVLLFVAIGPILFSWVPKQLLAFSVMFPVVAFYLLWGGTLWFPVAIIIGLGLVGYVFIYASDRSGMLIGVLSGLLVFLVFFLDPLTIVLSVIEAFAGIFTANDLRIPASIFGFNLRGLFPLMPHIVDSMQGLLPVGLKPLTSDQFGGFLLSSVIGISGITFSLPLGILLALGRQSDLLIVKTFCVAFIEGFRGVPLITLLFVASLLLNYFLPPGTTFDVILRVIIMVTIFSAAYMAEVIRGGLAALPRGQYEAADALGLDYWRAQRLIIMPQALKVSIPGIVGNFIGLFKDTTLVSLISLSDPMQLLTQIRANTNWSGIYWELFIFVGLLFFIICFSMSRYSMYLENKLKTDHR